MLRSTLENQKKQLATLPPSDPSFTNLQNQHGALMTGLEQLQQTYQVLSPSEALQKLESLSKDALNLQAALDTGQSLSQV
jgi:hypothetical protein